MFQFVRSKSKGSARDQVGIREVRDDVLVLPGSRYRSILVTSSVNFELQSSDEQDAIVDSFQSFLNSLTIPIQILIRVRELDVDRYIEDFNHSRLEEDNPVYREQANNYGQFIRQLVAGNKILSRRFYVVVPYDGRSSVDFKVARERLLLDQELIIKGLEKLGVAARPLSSLEILELFYSFYRPDSFKLQPLREELIRNNDAAFI